MTTEIVPEHLQPLDIDAEVSSWGEWNGKRDLYFHVRRAGRSVDVRIQPAGADDQALADEVAELALAGLGDVGSATRMLRVEVADLRRALEEARGALAVAKDRLAGLDAGRGARGDFFAIEVEGGAVWLQGRPDDSAFGLRFASWGELAAERPELRPRGSVRVGDDIYTRMRASGEMR